MIALRFHQVDVFTTEFMFGNPVAVVHDADALTDAQMQAFAAWTNLSETTFLLAPTDPVADYRLRIFTPRAELPFAGHPTLGSARAWLEAGRLPHVTEALVQECGAGRVTVRRSGERLGFAAPALRRGGPVDPAEVSATAAALGLGPDDVLDAQWADNGPGWMALLLRDAHTVLGIELGAAARRIDPVGVVGRHRPGSAADYEVRAFAPSLGVPEDPVTGSLNAAIGQWLIPAGLAPPSYVVAQGTRLGRRGRVYVEQADGEIWVGGDTVAAMTATVEF